MVGVAVIVMVLIGNFYNSQAQQQQQVLQLAQQQQAQQQLVKLQECSSMLSQVDSEKGSWWARNFDGNAINQLVDHRILAN